MDSLLWVGAAGLFAIGVIVGAISCKEKKSAHSFVDRVEVVVKMHMTRDLVDKLERLGGALWVMDSIINTPVEEPPHTQTPRQ